MMARPPTRRGFLPWADRRGVAALEFALMAPVLVFSMFGFVELTRGLRATNMVNAASGAVATMVGQMTTVVGGSSGTLGDFCQAAGLLTHRFNVAGASAPRLSLSIANVTAVGNSGPNDPAFTSTLMWRSDGACTGTTGIMSTDPTITARPMLTRTGDSVVVVQASYNYQPMVSTAMFSMLALTLGRTNTAPALFGSIKCTNVTGVITQPAC
jgi:Flp pilus assembly protein TadG